jgi:hypothetical protein
LCRAGFGLSVVEMKISDDTLGQYLGNFVHGFDDKNQRRHLVKRGWISYVRKTWAVTTKGLAEAVERKIDTSSLRVEVP